ncbi:MAG: hypothetical protein HZA46_22680 [Planctomycetales bacterium]|nr:hypothetical protein [Planctomycetales bacterium]
MKELRTQFGGSVAEVIVALRCQRGLSVAKVAENPLVRQILGDYSVNCIKEVENKDFDAPVGLLPVLERVFGLSDGTIWKLAQKLQLCPAAQEMMRDGVEVLQAVDGLYEGLEPQSPSSFENGGRTAKKTQGNHQSRTAKAKDRKDRTVLQ